MAIIKYGYFIQKTVLLLNNRKALIFILTLAMLDASAYSASGTELGVQVEMRDSVNLLTDIYLPTG